MNVTQIKVVYEIHLLKEMRESDAITARRVDGLQVYSRFTELNRAVGHRMVLAGMEGAMVDDVGYASRRVVQRPPLSNLELAACVEEGLLHDARQMHSYVIGASLLMILLITCVGSTIFGIKYPSHVPGRMNPLVGPNGPT